MSQHTLMPGDETTELDLETQFEDSSSFDNNEPPAPWADEDAGRPRRKRTILIGAAAALALVLGGGAIAAANAHKALDLTVDGQQMATSSWSATVGDLLEANGVELGEYDVVIPPVDTPLTDGVSVEVLRAEAIDVLVDGEPQEMWTTANDVGAALAASDLEGSAPEMALTRNDDGTFAMGLPLAGDVRVDSKDGPMEYALESETELQDALDQWQITLGDLDELTVTADADGTAVLTVVRVEVTERTEQIEVPFDFDTVESDSYYEGTSRVTTEGQNGIIERVYEVTTRDGEVISEEKIAESTVRGTTDQVTTVGTKERPVVTAPASSSSSSSSASASSSVSGDVWAALAQCESGGNPSIVSSNGLYHGLYQFTVSTWQSVGGSGLPSQASASEQTERAKILQARSGWGQWPACSRKLGLL